jgi:hypothetical protein
MQNRLGMFRRSWGVYYWVDRETGKQGTLKTRDREEAARLLDAMRKSSCASDQVNLAMAQLHLQAANPDLASRTWQELFVVWIAQGLAVSTRERRLRAIERPWMRQLGKYRLSDPEAAKWIMENLKGNWSKEIIRGIQRLGISLGWLVHIPVPDIHLKVRKRDRKVTRAITQKEHEDIVAYERKSVRIGRSKADLGIERALYYELLWQTGAAQIDGANLKAENIDWSRNRLGYRRQKTGEKCLLGIGPDFGEFLRQLPSEGLLFPQMAAKSSGHRAAEFNRRRKLLELEGVSLHSYRYSWAERAAVVGMPLRWAQAALGHSSRVIAQAYARKAEIACPLPEDYRQGHEGGGEVRYAAA